MKLGKAFWDSLVVEQWAKTRIPHDSKASWWLGSGRALFFATILLLSLFVLLWRLFDLTVIRGHEFRVLADGNRTRELIRHAPRGILRDRTGKPLVENIKSYRLLWACENSSHDSCTSRLSESEAEQLEKSGLPKGSFLEVDYSRRYSDGQSIAHVIGYTGELSEAELADQYYILRHYRRGDRVGRIGAEAVYEEKLRGHDGRELVEIDAQGHIMRTLGRESEVPGEDVTLSIDAGLSYVVRTVYPQEERGAVIVTKPSTGEVLALYSSPTFEPNKFSLGMSKEEYASLLNNPQRPLFSRPLGGVYPPGSTFKIVTALAGLEEGAITKDTTVEDIGVLKIGPFEFPNWYFLQYGKTEGIVDIVKAIQRSNDIYFYKVGEWLGITKLATWARMVGLGKPLGIELAGEAAGLVPDPSWKESAFTTSVDRLQRNNLWYLGDTYHMAIGQGYLLVTPLQVNTWTNVIANGGKLCRPTIEKIQNSKFSAKGGSASGRKIQNCKDLNIKKETINLIQQGMEKACATGGTGWPLFEFSVKSSIEKRETSNKNNVSSPSGIPDSRNSTLVTRIPVACKTGTAEYGDPDNKTHAWFTTFAPVTDHESVGTRQVLSPNEKILTGDPELSITVLVEGAGEGSNVAAPIAKKILEEWFRR